MMMMMMMKKKKDLIKQTESNEKDNIETAMMKCRPRTVTGTTDDNNRDYYGEGKNGEGRIANTCGTLKCNECYTVCLHIRTEKVANAIKSTDMRI